MVFVSTDGTIAVSLESAALKVMLREARRAAPRETGGILIGHYIGHYRATHDHAVVEEATAPPSDSKLERTTFFRGVVGLASLLQRRWRRGRYYVGDWHFHPNASAEPSPRDLAQMRALAKDRDYQCARPIMIVIGGAPPREWSITAAVVGATTIRLDPLAVRAAPGRHGARERAGSGQATVRGCGDGSGVWTAARIYAGHRSVHGHAEKKSRERPL